MIPPLLRSFSTVSFKRTPPATRCVKSSGPLKAGLYPIGPSIEILPTLGPEVYRLDLFWAVFDLLWALFALLWAIFDLLWAIESPGDRGPGWRVFDPSLTLKMRVSENQGHLTWTKSNRILQIQGPQNRTIFFKPSDLS